jgi:uncharacterized protein (TIGR02246 family)
MRKRVSRQLFLGFAILLPYFNALGLQAPSPTPPNRDAIAAVVQELDAAWNAREPARFSAVFSEDGSFGFPVEGIALRGRDEIRGYYAKLFTKMPPDLRHLTTIGYFEIINPDLVAVDFEVDILGTDPKTGTTQAPLVHYHGLGLGVRKDSGWRIRLARVYPVAK